MLPALPRPAAVTAGHARPLCPHPLLAQEPCRPHPSYYNPEALLLFQRASLSPYACPSRLSVLDLALLTPVDLAGDIVLLRHMTQPTRTYLSSPLYETDDPVREQTACVKTHIGVVAHKDILYKRVRDVVATKNGRPGFRLTFPTLEEHILKTRRLVTPVRRPQPQSPSRLQYRRR